MAHHTSKFSVGQQVEYHSSSQAKWIKATVTDRTNAGKLELDVRPGILLTHQEILDKIREVESDQAQRQADAVRKMREAKELARRIAEVMPSLHDSARARMRKEEACVVQS